MLFELQGLILLSTGGFGGRLAGVVVVLLIIGEMDLMSMMESPEPKQTDPISASGEVVLSTPSTPLSSVAPAAVAGDGSVEGGSGAGGSGADGAAGEDTGDELVMAAAESVPLPWNDRFETPTIEVLFNYDAEHPKSPRDLVWRLHGEIAGLKSVRPLIRWLGHSWCWTVAYRHPALGRDAAAELAYCIPHVKGLQISVPFDAELRQAFGAADHLNGDAFLSKGLALAAEPNEFLWPIWSPVGAGQVDALRNLIRWKHGWLMGR